MQAMLKTLSQVARSFAEGVPVARRRICPPLVLALAPLLLACALSGAAQVSQWTGSVSTAWGTADNWNPLGVPNNVDVEIDHTTDLVNYDPGGSSNFPSIRSLLNDGVLQLQSGALSIAGATSRNALDNRGSILIEGGALLVSAATDIDNAGLINAASSTQPPLSLFTTASMNNTGQIEIHQDFGNISAQNLLTNAGMMQADGGSVLSLNAATMVNIGTLDAHDGATIFLNNSGPSNAVVSTGTVKIGATGTMFASPQLILQGSDAVLAGDAVQNGNHALLVAGIGVLQNGGLVSPGDTGPGELEISGDFSEQGGGASFHVDGRVRGLEYSALDVDGNVSGHGVWDILFGGSLLSGPDKLHAGDFFDLVSFDSFDTSSLFIPQPSNLPPGLLLNIAPVYNDSTDTSGFLRLNVVAVPELASALLFVSGLAPVVLTWRLYRRPR